LYTNEHSDSLLVKDNSTPKKFSQTIWNKWENRSRSRRRSE
jgi:hypothetical protein